MDIFNFIKSQCSITQVVGDYTTLKKMGNYWKGCCPFHSERTASFTVTPHKDIFYCFGCHKGGDVIAFIAQIEHCTQLEAARHLAERYGITLPEEVSWEKTDKKSEQKRRYLSLYQVVTQWLTDELSASALAQNYIQQRNITARSCQEFEIGYFPAGQAALKRLLQNIQKQGFLLQDLFAAHIVLEGKKTIYSPFEERIIFPIKDHLGRICGFGGRIFQPEDQRAKYYNSHDHSFFSKSSLLFGLHTAKKRIQQDNRVFLVEGYTDCIAMTQAGYTNTVATLGTACTTDHLKLLARYTAELWVLYDGDAAGKNALIRLSELCWETDLELMVLQLPVGEDPASYLSKHPTLDSIIAQAQDIFSFSIKELSHSFGSQSLQDKMHNIKELVQSVGRIKDLLKQDLLLQKMALACSLPLETLKRELTSQKNSSKLTSDQAYKPQHPTKDNLLLAIKNTQKEITLLDRQMFSAILSYNGFVAPDDKAFLSVTLPPNLAHIVQQFDEISEQKGSRDFSSFFTQLSEEEKEYVGTMLITEEGENSPENFQKLLIQYQKKQWKALVSGVTQQLKEAQAAQNTEAVQKIIAEFQDLKTKMVQKGLV